MLFRCVSNGRMPSMPGTNLTREEAQTRAALLSVESYSVDLDLTVSDKVFESTTVLRFTCSEPGASTFADLVGATIHEVVLNGEKLDAFDVYRDSRIRLDNLQADNELRLFCELPYSHTGEGLHRFVDPADGKVYLYSQFEVPDARRVFTTFEQPDLKSTFTFTVTAPSHWVVVSNAPTPAPEEVTDTTSVWRFPTTNAVPPCLEWQDAQHAWNQPDPRRGADPRRTPVGRVVFSRSRPHRLRQGVREHDRAPFHLW